MVLTLEIANNYILANIDESIILLDDKLKIMTINNKTVELLDYPADILKTYYISKIILESESIKTELNKIQISKSNDFSCRVHFIKKDNSNILMDTKFKVIKDKFTDILGILIIGKEVKELKQFNKLYKITSRQSEIIQKMISGKSNRQIAQSLGVSERTIKGHITNIYYKLGGNNKMQLLNLLKDFNLIPAQPTEKPFFFKEKIKYLFFLIQYLRIVLLFF